jgi:hypothetical protein
VEEVLAQVAVDPAVRPAEVAIGEWGALSDAMIEDGRG